MSPIYSNYSTILVTPKLLEPLIGAARLVLAQLRQEAQYPSLHGRQICCLGCQQGRKPRIRVASDPCEQSSGDQDRKVEEPKSEMPLLGHNRLGWSALELSTFPVFPMRRDEGDLQCTPNPATRGTDIRTRTGPGSTGMSCRSRPCPPHRGCTSCCNPSSKPCLSGRFGCGWSRPPRQTASGPPR